MSTFCPFGSTGAQKISEVSFVTFWHFCSAATAAGIIPAAAASDTITRSIGIWRFAVKVGTCQASI